MSAFGNVVSKDLRIVSAWTPGNGLGGSNGNRNVLPRCWLNCRHQPSRWNMFVFWQYWWKDSSSNFTQIPSSLWSSWTNPIIPLIGILPNCSLWRVGWARIRSPAESVVLDLNIRFLVGGRLCSISSDFFRRLKAPSGGSSTSTEQALVYNKI